MQAHVYNSLLVALLKQGLQEAGRAPDCCTGEMPSIFPFSPQTHMNVTKAISTLVKEPLQTALPDSGAVFDNHSESCNWALKSEIFEWFIFQPAIW